MSIKVLIADDHAIVAEGLRALINAHDGFEVVACVDNGRDAVHQARKHNADIAILDIAMPELNGIDAAAELHERAPEVKVIILSMHSNHEYVVRALQAGARGYVLKKAAGQEVLDAIMTVHSGRRFLSSEIADNVVDRYLSAQTATQPVDRLSLRERQVLQLTVEGQSVTTIATALNLAPGTVETYRARLMQKLDIKDLPGLVKFAIQQGITPLE